jgi:hypothetical protein
MVSTYHCKYVIQNIFVFNIVVAAMVSEINMVHLSALLLDQYGFRDQHSFNHQLELLKGTLALDF